MPVILPPVSPPTGTLRYDWLDPGGVLRDLTWASSPNRFVGRGSAGLGSPPVEIDLEKLPNTAGSVPRRTRTAPLEIDLPISVHASTFAGLLTAVEDLREQFDTSNERGHTPGYLRITRPHDDAVRQIACLYTGGLEGDLNEGSPTWAPVVVSLVAPDPYWTDITETEAIFDSGDVGVTQAVLNLGDFDAYPIWTINGPASAITITNHTTEKAFALTANGGLTLTAGDILTIDTRPASQRTTLQVTDDEGVSYFSKLSAGSALWWLVPGSNAFTIAATGAIGDTSFTVAWLPRYRGVLR